jgi:hypothetical protein
MTCSRIGITIGWRACVTAPRPRPPSRRNRNGWRVRKILRGRAMGPRVEELKALWRPQEPTRTRCCWLAHSRIERNSGGARDHQRWARISESRWVKPARSLRVEFERLRRTIAVVDGGPPPPRPAKPAPVASRRPFRQFRREAPSRPLWHRHRRPAPPRRLSRQESPRGLAIDAAGNTMPPAPPFPPAAWVPTTSPRHRPRIGPEAIRTADAPRVIPILKTIVL